jgi:hypothetical protein
LKGDRGKKQQGITVEGIKYKHPGKVLREEKDEDRNHTHSLTDKQNIGTHTAQGKQQQRPQIKFKVVMATGTGEWHLCPLHLQN